MRATAARAAALQVMQAVRRGTLADRALRRAQAGLEARDRAWLQELVYGTMRLRGRLDHRISQASRRPLDGITPDVLDILRLGAYQLTEMGGVPPYAAVSESVELSKPQGRGASGFVNGVLKAIAVSDPAAGFPDPGDAVAYLSTWGSHPAWLIERWLDRFGTDGTRRLVAGNNERPRLYLRPLQHTPDAACAVLAEQGIEASVVIGLKAVRLGPNTLPETALALVPAMVQDPAAGLVVDGVSVPAGAMVADLCAAPGGKALALAAAGAGYVIASDISVRRLRRLRENAQRLAALRIGVVAADARRPAIGPVDVVLVDAPCSGTGTFRRHPDARWRVAARDIGALAVLQDAILAGAARHVAPGGVLVYATCTLEREENEDRVEAFLGAHPDFGLEACSAVNREYVDAHGRLMVLPHVHGFDGAFAARLRRRQ